VTRILLTGAAGRIGAVMRAELPAFGWAVRSFDLRPLADPLPGDDVRIGDLNDPAALADALAGVEAVVHLAAIPTEAPFDMISRANIEGTYSVFEGARRAGVGRIVVASSIHASGYSPRVPLLGVDEPARPDSFYGLRKVVGEALGRLYVDRYGMQVACLRIGAFQPRPRSPHQLAHWLSHGDAVRLVHACLSAPDLGYALLYGRSANTRGWTDLGPALALGYRPQDDSETYAEEVLAAGRGTIDGLVGQDLIDRDNREAERLTGP